MKVDLVIQENKMMQKFFILILFFGLSGAGCKTSVKTQHTSNDISSGVTPVSGVKPVTSKSGDSAAVLKQQLTTAINAPLNFTTFYGRAKASYSSAKVSGNATVYIKIQKDSVIWISVTGPLNIEGARVLVTPDSVKIINKLENTVQLSSIEHLQEITKLPFNFNDLQNIILGKPVLNNTDNLDVEIKQDSITVKEDASLLKYIHYFTRGKFLLGQSNFQTSNNTEVTGANIFFNDYHDVSNMKFSESRDIAVTGTSPSELQLKFKEYNFNQPQNFVFTISKNYRIKYE